MSTTDSAAIETQAIRITDTPVEFNLGDPSLYLNPEDPHRRG